VINKTTLDILITGLQTQLNTDKNNWRAIESYLFGIWSVSEMAAIDMVRTRSISSNIFFKISTILTNI
jgi:hypothetical protein